MITAVGKRVAFAVACCHLFASAAAAAEQYICVPDKATGFHYDKGAEDWEVTRFKTDSKYVVAAAKDGRNAFTWTKIGSQNSTDVGYCKDDFNNVRMLFCDIFGGQIKFNRTNGRYIFVFYLGYYDVGIPGPISETDESSGTPMIEIGKCSPF